MSLQEKLYQVYLLDKNIRGLRTRLDAGTAVQKVQQTKLDQLARQRSELAEQHKLARAKSMTLESQAREADERVTKLRDQMNSVKTNKEYSALLIEVNTLKIEKGKLEDQALEQMGKVETLQKQIDEVELKIADQQKMLKHAEGEVAAAKAEVGEQLDKLSQERQQAAEGLPADVRTQFERALVVQDGEAMAEVIEESRKHLEYSCGGCYMQIPVERVNDLMRKPNDLTTCPACGRILYLQKELRQSLSVSR